MRNFKVQVSSHVTILEEDTFSVGAIDEADARQMVKEAFNEAMNAKYGWCDYDDVHIEECVEC